VFFCYCVDIQSSTVLSVALSVFFLLRWCD